MSHDLQSHVYIDCREALPGTQVVDIRFAYDIRRLVKKWEQLYMRMLFIPIIIILQEKRNFEFANCRILRSREQQTSKSKS